MTQTIPPFYDKTMTCDICAHSFTTKKMRSRFIRVERVENDFYKTYKEPLLNPLLYEGAVCPECGYSFTDSFLPVKKDEVKEAFQKKVSSSWKKRDFGGERDYDTALTVMKLALLSSKITSQPYGLMGSICLRIAWLYRYQENSSEEARFLEQAAAQYEKSFLDGDFKDIAMSELALLFILGECYRRAGNKEKARKYFSKVIEHKDKHLEPNLVERTREQWYETKAN